jgi:hypothetical protein
MGESRVRGYIGVAVAVMLVAAYLLALRSQWINIDAKDLTWARRSQLMTGLEALAFAAAGALLGTTVQRSATVEARKDAEAQRERATASEAQARSAVVMRAALEAKRAAAATPRRFAGAEVADETQQVLLGQFDEVLAAGKAALDA